MSAQAEPAQISLQASGPVARRQLASRLSRWLLLLATFSGLIVLALLGYDTLRQGGGRLIPLSEAWDFVTSYPSRTASRAGLRSSILGSAWVLGATLVMAFPVAVGTAIWIEEFAPKNRILTFVKLNLSNLAGVPSIIYGILGLAIFVRYLDLGPSILAGALTLSFMIMPMTVIASQEAIKQVPSGIREASLALGATEWQTVWFHVLPGAMPGIMTGIILAISRAIGETAALIMIGAFTFVAFDPSSLSDDFTTVPIQIYNWTIRPQQAFRENAAAAIIILMIAVLGLNLTAAIIRERFQHE